MGAAVEAAITGDVTVAAMLDSGVAVPGGDLPGDVILSIEGTMVSQIPMLRCNASGAVIVHGTLGTPPPITITGSASVTAPKATASIPGSISGGPWEPPAPVIVGSAPVGTTAYPIPQTGQVLYVSTTGNDASAGTLTQPKRTLAGAVSASLSGATIVLRSGSYHESLTLSKALTIQAYPNEAVWLDGSTVYSSWTGSGPWTSALGPDWSPINSSNYPHSDPAANLPEQVWIDGVALKQLPDGQTPATGQFSVNRTAQTITIGTNPAGHEVRVADLNHCLVYTATCTARGFGVRRYSPLAIEGISAMFYFGGSSQGSVIENVVLQDSGVTGLATARQITLRNITVQDCFQSGIQATTANGLLIEDFVIRRINRGLWNGAPITAGIKITKTDGSTIRNGLISDVCRATGLWWDTFCPRFFASNVVVDGATAFPGGTQMDQGIYPEGVDGGFFDGIQHRGWIVNCRTTNTKSGIKLVDAGWITVANCKVESYTSVGMYLQQDERRNTGTKPGEGTIEQSPWLTLHNNLLNNDIGAGVVSSVAQVIGYQDPVAWTPAQLGWDCFDRVAGNWFRPVPPGSMVQLGTDNGSRLSYNSLADLANSPAAVGGPPGSKLGVNHRSTTAPDHDIADVLPAEIYAALGLPNGLKRVGPFLPSPVASF